jgi:light-regulated signal transduction histidine kinase (bacteriophytochrome)
VRDIQQEIVQELRSLPHSVGLAHAAADEIEKLRARLRQADAELAAFKAAYPHNSGKPPIRRPKLPELPSEIADEIARKVQEAMANVPVDHEITDVRMVDGHLIYRTRPRAVCERCGSGFCFCRELPDG